MVQNQLTLISTGCYTLVFIRVMPESHQSKVKPWTSLVRHAMAAA